MSEQGIEITQEGGKANIVLDMSMFDLFELCHARYNYRHNMQKAPPINEKSSALDIGGLLHEGFEVYFKGIKSGKQFNDRMDESIKRIQAVSSDPDLSNSSPEDVNDLIRAFEQSCEHWRFEDEMMEILEVEQPFAYVIHEDEHIRIIITGKIDLLVNIPPIGRNPGYTGVPIDHKSFRRDFEVPRLSNQFQNYCYATKSNYLFVNRVGLQKTLKPEDKFKRIPLSYDHLLLEQWKQNVIYSILDDYLTCLANDRWRMRFTSCFAWNRKCEYYDICETSGDENKLYKLESRFATVQPWDVTAKFNKGG